jgi:hypothetical protein
VKSVVQLDETNLRWRAEIGGRKLDWTARITEQIPSKRIAWTSTSGPYNAGVVTFHRLGDGRCRVALRLDYEPEACRTSPTCSACWLPAPRAISNASRSHRGRRPRADAWRACPVPDDASAR